MQSDLYVDVCLRLPRYAQCQAAVDNLCIACLALNTLHHSAIGYVSLGLDPKVFLPDSRTLADHVPGVEHITFGDGLHFSWSCFLRLP